MYNAVYPLQDQFILPMFENYPKKRPELPIAFQEIYADHYKKNRDGGTRASSLSQRMEAWMHRQVARDVIGRHHLATLEIGAGTLNQLNYEQTRPYDIIEPFSELFSQSHHLAQIDTIYRDIDDIGTEKQYDRITSIATFEHILDLPKVVAKTCLLLKEGGTLRVAIPNEGTILWKLGWKLTTGIEFKLKHGLDYEIMMQHEHVNNAEEVDQVLTYFYKTVRCSSFGINKKLAFYRYYECSVPDTVRAVEYLQHYADAQDNRQH